jgi:protein CLEC16A
MLKSIAAKLDDSTIHIFYNEKIPTFPLLWQAIRFHNHPEALIRNTSRNIVLSIFKLSEPRVKEYLASFPFVIYYSHLVSELKTIWTAIDKIRGKESEAEREELPLLMDEHVDLLMYIEDLASVCN